MSGESEEKELDQWNLSSSSPHHLQFQHATVIMHFSCKLSNYPATYTCKKLSSKVYTVEPPNNGQVGDKHFVHCSEVVPSSEVENVWTIYRQGVNSLSIVGRLSLFRVSIIRGSTVYTDC